MYHCLCIVWLGSMAQISEDQGLVHLAECFWVFQVQVIPLTCPNPMGKGCKTPETDYCTQKHKPGLCQVRIRKELLRRIVIPGVFERSSYKLSVTSQPCRMTDFPLSLISTALSNCRRLPSAWLEALLNRRCVLSPPFELGAFHGNHVLQLDVSPSFGVPCSSVRDTISAWASMCSLCGDAGSSIPFVWLSAGMTSGAVRISRWLVDVCGLAGSLTSADADPRGDVVSFCPVTCFLFSINALANGTELLRDVLRSACTITASPGTSCDLRLLGSPESLIALTPIAGPAAVWPSLLVALL